MSRLFLVMTMIAALAAPAFAEEKPRQIVVATDIPCKTEHTGPSPWLLLGTGVAIAPIAYELGVMWHEGSHAVWAAGFGAKITDYHPLPSIQNGHILFGYTAWTGQLSDTQSALVTIAPKFTDLAIIGAYTITNETGHMPENKWAQLAMTALAATAVVDLGHDVFQTNPEGDIPKFIQEAHVNGTAFRILQGSLTLAGAVEVGHGIYNLFAPVKVTPKKDKSGKTADFSITPYFGGQTAGVSGTF